MMKSLLERFDITVPDTLEKYNLIGFDFGDGEISAAIPYWDSTVGQEGMSVKNLFLNKQQDVQKKITAYEVIDDTPQLPTGKTLHLVENLYYNFKRCPGTEESKSNYIKDDGTADTKSYEEIMAAGFNAAVRTIFQCNPDYIDVKKKTIILVGRPSSSRWEDKEHYYAELLRKGLNLEDITKEKIYVAIQSESWAALAWEAGQRNFESNEVVAVLDNGSSTFDITVIGRKGLFEGRTGEDSFQFGGNNLDENLLQMMWKEFHKQFPQGNPQYEHGHKLALREFKELHYGENGTDNKGVFYSFYVDLPNNKKKIFTFAINEETMNTALNKEPVAAFHVGESIGDLMPFTNLSETKSWLACCEEIYTKFYKKILPRFTEKGSDGNPSKVLSHIILSGGVSVMPEVKQVAGKVFGKEPELTVFPNYTVSRGLAYILGCEVQKAQYLSDLLRKLDRDILPSAYSLRTQIISAGVDEDWNTFEKAIENWANTYIEKSIKDFGTFHSEVFNRDLSRPVQKGAENWYNANNTQTRINQMLREKFQAMFPQFVADFNYPLPPMDFNALNGVVVYIRIDYCFFFGWMTANEDDNRILPDSSLTEKRDRAWRQEAKNIFLDLKNEICDGGSKKIKYDGKGFFGGLHDFFFGRNGTTVSYKGLKNMYGEELTDEKVTNIRKQILGILKERMKEHVERITPYFNMSARF